MSGPATAASTCCATAAWSSSRTTTARSKRWSIPGALTAEEARGHSRSNIVTRAVGAGEPLDLDVRHAAILPGDLFLICSDGLNGMVSDEEIRRVLSAMAPEQAADGLIALSLDRGARDNVTIVLVSTEP